MTYDKSGDREIEHGCNKSAEATAKNSTGWFRGKEVDKMKLVFLKEAMELCGATDQTAFKAEAKKFKCLYERAGVVKIDIEKLHAALDVEFTQMAVDTAIPKTKKRGEGNVLGWVVGRLKLYAGRKAKKLAKIANVKEAIKAATTVYDRRKLNRDLSKLEDGLKRLEEGKLADEARRDAIMNGSVDDSGDSESNA